jgi:hypothetical protein
MVSNVIQCQLAVTAYAQLVAGSRGFQSQPGFKWEMAEGRVVNCRWCVVSRSGAGVLLDFSWRKPDENGAHCAWAVAGCKSPHAGCN